MAWWGKVLGGAVGYLLGGPLGALLGVSLGHRLDAGAEGSGESSYGAGHQERVQTAFFTATFAVMGHIAKADGRVTRDEIAIAQELMANLNLNQAQRKLAKSLFNSGKRVDFNLDEILQQFRRECHRRGTLLQIFMEIQIRVALADGRIVPEENAVLQQVAQTLGIAPSELAQLIDQIRGGYSSHGAFHERDAQPALADAYSILGVTADTPLAEIRKAYRRLRSQYHPDKLVSKGLPEEMIKVANDKTHEIRTAWEQIKKARQRSAH